MKNLLLISFFIVLFSACDSGQNFVTESGIEVSYIEKGSEEGPVADSVLIVYLKYETDDSTLFKTNPNQPLAIRFDPDMEAGNLQEVLTYLKVGDSVGFDVTAQNLFESTYRTQVPDFLSKEDLLHVNMKLEDQMSQEAYMQYSRELALKRESEAKATLEEKAVSDAEEIDAFLAESNIEATKTESGLRYVITQEGSGQEADSGDKVTVHYSGRLLNGEKFDASYDRNEPFEFDLGMGRVIPGWDEGIAYLKEGDKATFYIPSPLAYAQRSPSPKIPPYSILVFDVEVLEVKKKK